MESALDRRKQGVGYMLTYTDREKIRAIWRGRIYRFRRNCFPNSEIKYLGCFSVFVSIVFWRERYQGSCLRDIKSSHCSLYFLKLDFWTTGSRTLSVWTLCPRMSYCCCYLPRWLAHLWGRLVQGGMCFRTTEKSGRLHDWCVWNCHRLISITTGSTWCVLQDAHGHA